MKRIINTVLIVATLSAAGFTLNSCQDALDIKQAGELEDKELYTTVSNLNEALYGGVYGQIDPIDEIYFTAVFTDEVKPGSGSGGQEYEIHRFFLDPSSPIVGGGGISTQTSDGIWRNHYRVINRINRLLEGAKNVKPAANEVNTYNGILAQARAMRAYCYMQLEAYFSTDMKDPNALGVILLKDIPASDAKLPRATNKEVYDFINADLDYARGILSYSTSARRYVIDKAFVNSVSARFNLYRGEYALAKQYATEVISKSGLKLTEAKPMDGVNTAVPLTEANGQPFYSGAYPFSLPAPGPTPADWAKWNIAFYGGTAPANGNGTVGGSFNPYRRMWADTDNGEVIFSLNRLPLGAGLPIGERFNTNGSTVSGVPMWFLGRNLFNLIYDPAVDKGDIRRYTYIDPTSVINAAATNPTSDRLVIDKYPGKVSTATRNDIKVFRLSEMKFILAEAEVAAGNLTAAHDLIQEVRVARNYLGTATTPTYTNAQFAYADILKERRIELGLEGHRYIDLKRLATIAGVTMDRNAKDDIIPTSNLPNDSYKYTLPIPIQETSANPNCKQNPGY
ncbi:RagB/SusD family nutrient uptake outer membrane protein [Chryseobacterium arthrosphaerae]|uniref:RagB/SusD family nutrient uptake outer membrane protein n=1 Tax=Chryseobacterium arthrosphaerae TaxID=651561 RepID=UPI001BAFDBA3|nr:RagB/SusD family nutrient uptake outer membrane protein [Chryseobacterium arthrosphaerae]QUY55606.1 RagB/SusD family nutrient uptake outer membrane protein [Chryseobacterium arthrosphaerae]WES96799.1 RagB/SusD family nutrient uptake outer membrane protein [Chryseobacterium arthrosphaerae]